jgi:beta-glucanase (GH16 family)
MASKSKIRPSLWMLALIALLLALQGLAPANLHAQPPAAAPTLLFDDEFDGSTLDANKWVPTYWFGNTIDTNNELEWYLPNNVSVSNGTLKLTALKQTVNGGGKTYNYTSGVITTGRNSSDVSKAPKFEFQYGYAEMRAKVPKGKGLWPAFWTLSCDQNWPPEIDVTEIIGDQPTVNNMTLHYSNSDGSDASSGGEWSGPDLSAGWHTYGVDWEPSAIVWYVDGVEHYRYSTAANIPAEKMYLLLNMAIGGDWPGSPDGSTVFPATFEVDYVHVWSSRPTGSATPPAATATPTRTPTRPAATATPTRTLVPPTATATPTRTPTRPAATATPTRTPTRPAATATPPRTPGPRNRRSYLPFVFSGH